MSFSPSGIRKTQHFRVCIKLNLKILLAYAKHCHKFLHKVCKLQGIQVKTHLYFLTVPWLVAVTVCRKNLLLQQSPVLPLAQLFLSLGPLIPGTEVKNFLSCLCSTENLVTLPAAKSLWGGSEPQVEPLKRAINRF